MEAIGKFPGTGFEVADWLGTMMVTGEACATGSWSYATLDESIGFRVGHRVEGSTLHLKLSAAMTGWLGFGFAEMTSGHMKGADMVTAYVADGTVYAQDRHALFAPTTDAGSTYEGLFAFEDEHNDWSIEWGSESNGETSVHLSRALSTNDAQDREVGRGPQRIIWAWGDADFVSYHASHRGAGVVTFVGSSSGGSAAGKPLPLYDGIWEGRFKSYVMPARGTTYACQSMHFSFADGGVKHIVAIRPLDAKKYHHHAILHVCANNSYWQQHSSPQVCASDVDQGGGGGGASPLGALNSGCSSLMWSWAVGGGAFVLPESAGFRVRGGGSHSACIRRCAWVQCLS